VKFQVNFTDFHYCVKGLHMCVWCGWRSPEN
jgi:hypothetical protein